MPHKICPICGQEFYNSANKVICCSRACAAKRQTVRGERPCAVCGTMFRPSTKRSTTCSVACRGIAQRKEGSRSTFVCDWCGKDFEEWTYRKPRFCSRQCNAEWSSRQPKPTTRRPEHFVTICCEQCGKDYVVHISQVEYRNSRFCSKPCRARWVSENVVGENHPRYIGGTRFPDRGASWSAQRKKAFKRDGGKCRICGRKAKKSEKRVVDVHHITPYREFNGDHITANDLLNLITLCRRCHNLVEDYGYPCPQPLL